MLSVGTSKFVPFSHNFLTNKQKWDGCTLNIMKLQKLNFERERAIGFHKVIDRSSRKPHDYAELLEEYRVLDLISNVTTSQITISNTISNRCLESKLTKICSPHRSTLMNSSFGHSFVRITTNLDRHSRSNGSYSFLRSLLKDKCTESSL